jgi:hypothetical protein
MRLCGKKLAAWIRPAAVLAGMLCAAIVLYLYNPTTSGVYPSCPLRAWTGLYCPGCGTLRALHQLLHGHVLRAMEYNPLTVLSIPILGILVAFRKIAYRPSVAYAALGILVLFGILRNLPVWPFFLLAPR